MTLSQDDQFITLRGAGGKALPFKLTRASAQDDLFIPVLAANGVTVPMKVTRVAAQDDKSFPVLTADGKVVLVKEAGGLGKLLTLSGSQYTGGLPGAYAAVYDLTAKTWDNFAFDGNVMGVTFQNYNANFGFDNTVYWKCSLNGTLYASGRFEHFYGAAVARFAKWNDTTQKFEQASDPVAWNTYKHGIVVYNGSVYCSFTQDNSSERIWRFDGTNWSTCSFGEPTSGNIYGLKLWGDKLVAYGSFAGGPAGTSKLATYDGANWASIGVPNNTVWDVAELDGDLYVGGQFTDIGGNAYVGIARYDGSNWHDLDGGLERAGAANGYALGLCDYNSKIHCAGMFIKAGNEDLTNFAIWDGTTWSAWCANNDNAYVNPTVMEVIDNEIVLGKTSRFTIDGVTGFCFLAWTGTGWKKWGSPGSQSGARNIHEYNGKAYVAAYSQFYAIGGELAYKKNIYDADAQSWTGNDMYFGLGKAWEGWIYDNELFLHVYRVLLDSVWRYGALVQWDKENQELKSPFTNPWATSANAISNHFDDPLNEGHQIVVASATWTDMVSGSTITGGIITFEAGDTAPSSLQGWNWHTTWGQAYSQYYMARVDWGLKIKYHLGSGNWEDLTFPPWFIPSQDNISIGPFVALSNKCLIFYNARLPGAPFANDNDYNRSHGVFTGSPASPSWSSFILRDGTGVTWLLIAPIAVCGDRAYIYARHQHGTAGNWNINYAIGYWDGNVSATEQTFHIIYRVSTDRGSGTYYGDTSTLYDTSTLFYQPKITPLDVSKKTPVIIHGQSGFAVKPHTDDMYHIGGEALCIYDDSNGMHMPGGGMPIGTTLPSVISLLDWTPDAPT